MVCLNEYDAVFLFPMLAGTVIFNEVIKREHMFLIISANRDINELGKKR